MAYSGSTASSSLANPPTLSWGGQLTRGSSIGANPRGHQMWDYTSSDGSTVTSAANYFTDAWYLGIRAGDTINGVFQSSLGTSTQYSYRLIVTSVTTAGAVCSTGQMSTG